MITQPEVWLRGPLPGVDPALMPAAHALLQTVEDVERAVADLSTEQLWFNPGYAASVGFHVMHLVSRPRDSRHNSRAGHPDWRRCSSLTNSRFARSSRLAIRAPRSGIYATNHAVGTRAGSTDRLLTYARGMSLTDAQKTALAAEKNPPGGTPLRCWRICGTPSTERWRRYARRCPHRFRIRGPSAGRRCQRQSSG